MQSHSYIFNEDNCLTTRATVLSANRHKLKTQAFAFAKGKHISAHILLLLSLWIAQSTQCTSLTFFMETTSHVIRQLFRGSRKLTILTTRNLCWHFTYNAWKRDCVQCKTCVAISNMTWYPSFAFLEVVMMMMMTLRWQSSLTKMIEIFEMLRAQHSQLINVA